MEGSQLQSKLSVEVSKNELLCTTLREILNVPELVVGSGILDHTPPLHSPFKRSQMDMYIYHKDYYKQQGIVSVAYMVKDKMEKYNDKKEQEDDDEKEVMITTSSVWEMKNSEKAVSNCLLTCYILGTN